MYSFSAIKSPRINNITVIGERETRSAFNEWMNEECEKEEEKKRDKLSKSKGQRGRESGVA